MFYKQTVHYRTNLFLFYSKPLTEVTLFAISTLVLLKKKNLFAYVVSLDFCVYNSNYKQIDLFNNSLFFIHPVFVLLLLFIATSLLFSIKKNTMAYFIFFLFLGLFWSAQEVFWNGLWDWNILELSNLLSVYIICVITHFKNNKQVKSSVILILIYLIYFFNNYIDAKSVHSFFFIPVNVYSLNVVLLTLFIFFYKNPAYLLLFFLVFFYKTANVLLLQNVFFFNKFFVFFYFYFFKKISWCFFWLINPYSFIFTNTSCFIYFFFKNVKHFLIKTQLYSILYLNTLNLSLSHRKLTLMNVKYYSIRSGLNTATTSFKFLKLKQFGLLLQCLIIFLKKPT